MTQILHRQMRTALPVAVRAQIERLAYAHTGFFTYPMGDTLDGRRGDHVLLAPPFIVQAHELDVIVERLASALDAALAGLPRELPATA